jgi:putative MFS transporter
MSGFALETVAPAAGGARVPLTAYQKKLMFFLSVATFFEGFDFMAIGQVLPSIRAEMGLSEAGAGWLIAFINVGAIVAYLLVRQADKIGRKRVLTATILGYAAFSMASGLSPNVVVFAVCQFFARIFLIGEWAVATIYAAEEYPADRRGFIIGVIQAMSSLGAIICAGLVPLLLKSPLGWRTVFLVGGIPLLVIAVARRGIQETARFEARQATGEMNREAPFARIWKTAYAGRVVLVACIWAATYVCTTTAVMFWKEFAVHERGFSDVEVGTSMTIAALGSLPLIFLSGKLLDALGRRGGAAIIFVSAAAGVFGAYGFASHAMLTVSLVVGIFGTSAVLPVLNAYTAELFPTELRSDAFAWANNLLGRFGPVLAPIVIGELAGANGWGLALRVTTVGPLVALALILWKLPETRGRELEATSAV